MAASVGDRIREFVHKQKQVRSAAEVARDSTLAPDGKFDTTNKEQQTGRPLHSSEIKNRLKKLNPAFHFEVAIADSSKIGIYIPAEEGKRFIMGMESGISPEFSIRKFKVVHYFNPETNGMDTRREWAGEIRGWRTILAKLIRLKLINRTQTEILFQVSRGRDSENWTKLMS